MLCLFFKLNMLTQGSTYRLVSFLTQRLMTSSLDFFGTQSTGSTEHIEKSPRIDSYRHVSLHTERTETHRKVSTYLHVSARMFLATNGH